MTIAPTSCPNDAYPAENVQRKCIINDTVVSLLNLFGIIAQWIHRGFFLFDFSNVSATAQNSPLVTKINVVLTMAGAGVTVSF